MKKNRLQEHCRAHVLYACRVQIFSVYFSPSLDIITRGIDLKPTCPAVAVLQASPRLLFGECPSPNGCLCGGLLLGKCEVVCWPTYD